MAAVATQHTPPSEVLSSSQQEITNTKQTCLQAHYCFSCVLVYEGTCMKITKLGQLYLREERSRVLHLSSLNAAMKRSASAPLRSAAMQATLLFNLHLSSVCVPFPSNRICSPTQRILVMLQTTQTSEISQTLTDRHKAVKAKNAHNLKWTVFFHFLYLLVTTGAWHYHPALYCIIIGKKKKNNVII